MINYFLNFYLSYKIYRRVKVVKPRTEDSFSSEEDAAKKKHRYDKLMFYLENYQVMIILGGVRMLEQGQKNHPHVTRKRRVI